MPTVPSPARSLTITRVLQGRVELNWLPPSEPNGEVHYVIEYKREDSGNWTSVNTTSDSTHYNLTGLHNGTNYSIRVVAVNSAGRATIMPTSNTATLNVGGIVAGVVVVFLLIMTLLTAGAAIMVRTKQRKWKTSHDVEEKTEPPGNTKREEREEAEIALHCEIVEQELKSESCDIRAQLLGEGNPGEVAGMNFTGEYYEIIDGQSVPLKPELHGESNNGHLTDKPTGKPNVVYAVIDKSKKKKPKTKDSGQSTKKGHRSDVEYIACSSPLQEDWLVNTEHKANHDDVGQVHSNDANGTGPQSEPCNPNVVYTVVDKSKKKRKEKTQGGASATTTQGAYTEEQHYEWSSAFGQDWLGNVVGGKPEGNHVDVEQGSTSNDAKGTDPQSEPCNPNAMYAVVNKSKKTNKGKTKAPTQVDKAQMDDISGDACEPLMQQSDGVQSNERFHTKCTNSRGAYIGVGAYAASRMEFNASN